jgi:hypothetical protein
MCNCRQNLPDKKQRIYFFKSGNVADLSFMGLSFPSRKEYSDDASSGRI